MNERHRGVIKRNQYSLLNTYFKRTNFEFNEFSEKDKGSIDDVLNYIVASLNLPEQYICVKTSKDSYEDRLWLRSYISHKLADMCKNKKIIRVRYGIYRPR